MSAQPAFPSQEIIGRIQKLRKINATPTQFKDMTAEEIARKIIADFDGSITIDVSKAPEVERAPIREAAAIDIDGRKPVVSILGDSTGTDDEGFTEEDEILREIAREILEDNGGEVNIGRIAFRKFIQTLLEDPNHYQLVRDEWNKFIVGHTETGKVNSPYESHHFPNVGLKRRSEGDDVLREQQIGFIKGIMEEFRDRVEDLFEEDDLPHELAGMKPHEQAGMNTLDARLLALGEAEYSNFVRGAVFYRYRRGEASLDDYAPRRLAANIIDEVNALYIGAAA